MICTGNDVKPTAGDTSSCPMVCNGTTEVPNSGHTECGMNSNTL